MDSKDAVFRELDRQPGRVHAIVSQGKTGTTTVRGALGRAGLDDLLWTHTLQPKRLAESEVRYADDPRRLRDVWAAQWMSSHPPTEVRPWSLATVVRDPVARSVSAFLYIRWRSASHPVAQSVDDELLALSGSINRQMARVSEHGLDWFDVNVKRVVGLDVYEHEFDPALGWGRITDDRADLLLLRTESLDQATDAIGAVFGVDVPPTLPAENATRDRSWADLYRAVLERFRAPAEYLDHVYDQPLARHFYSTAELDRFRQRWAGEG